ncbi:hypothetical protein ACEPAI_2919 [Sanghuangporus weigelae]
MFSKFSSFAFAIILAVATPALSQCDTSIKAMCCSSVAPAGSTAMAPILSAIGVVIQDVNVPVGVIGTESSGCDASPVCCTDTSHGAVAIGCLPVGIDI